MKPRIGLLAASRSGARWRLRLLIAIAAGAIGIVGMVAPAAAASPQAVTIVSHVTFNPDGPNYGDFTASGPAVGGGTMCASGTFVDVGLQFAGYQGRPGLVQIQVVKQFC